MSNVKIGDLYSEYGPEPTMGLKGIRKQYSNVRFIICAMLLAVIMTVCITLSIEARKKGIWFEMDYIPADKWVGSRQYFYLFAADIGFAALVTLNVVIFIRHKVFRNHGIEGIVVGYRKNARGGAVTNMDVTVEALINGKREYIRANPQGVSAKLFYPLDSKVTIYRMGRRWYL